MKNEKIYKFEDEMCQQNKNINNHDDNSNWISIYKLYSHTQT